MIKIYRSKFPSKWFVPLWMLLSIIVFPLQVIYLILVWWWRWARLQQLQTYRQERRYRLRLQYRLVAMILGYVYMPWDDPNNPFRQNIEDVTEAVWGEKYEREPFYAEENNG